MSRKQLFSIASRPRQKLLAFHPFCPSPSLPSLLLTTKIKQPYDFTKSRRIQTSACPREILLHQHLHRICKDSFQEPAHIYEKRHVDKLRIGAVWRTSSPRRPGVSLRLDPDTSTDIAKLTKFMFSQVKRRQAKSSQESP